MSLYYLLFTSAVSSLSMPSRFQNNYGSGFSSPFRYDSLSSQLQMRGGAESPTLPQFMRRGGSTVNSRSRAYDSKQKSMNYMTRSAYSYKTKNKDVRNKNVVEFNDFESDGKSDSIWTPFSEADISNDDFESDDERSSEKFFFAEPSDKDSSTPISLPFPSPDLTKNSNNRFLSFATISAYVCNMICTTAPIVLVPVISADPTFGVEAAGMTSASFVAKLASITMFGGLAGKIINGFVCQANGARRSLSLYLLCVSGCLAMISKCNTFGQLAFATSGLEFFGTIMWTASNVLFATHFADDPARFTRQVGILSLCSTFAQILSKVGISYVLSLTDWRTVSKCLTFVGLLGLYFVQAFVNDSPDRKVEPQVENASVGRVIQTIREVTSNPIFWRVGIAHATVFLVRTSDKVLGSFFRFASGLPLNICGGLTSSLTVGFAIGVIQNGNKYSSLDSPEKERLFVKSLYQRAGLCALALAACAIPSVSSLVGNSDLLAGIIILLSGAMAHSVSFQFYNLPSTYAKNCGENKAVTLSFMDAMGFLVSAPMWAATSSLVGGGGGVGESSFLGWSIMWTVMAGCMEAGSLLMLGALPAVLGWRKRDSSVLVSLFKKLTGGVSRFVSYVSQ